MDENETKPTPKPNKSGEKTYTREQLLKSKAYHDKRDLINALLETGVRYTKTQANKLISDYLKKEVN